MQQHWEKCQLEDLLLCLRQIHCGLSREEQEGAILSLVNLEPYAKHFGSRTHGFARMLNEQCVRGLDVGLGLKTHCIISKFHKLSFIWIFVKQTQTSKLVSDLSSIASHGMLGDSMSKTLVVVAITSKWNMCFRHGKGFTKSTSNALRHM